MNKLHFRQFLHKQIEEFEATNLPRNEITFLMFIITKLLGEDVKKFAKFYQKLKIAKSKNVKLKTI